LNSENSHIPEPEIFITIFSHFHTMTQYTYLLGTIPLPSLPIFPLMIVN
jgi:hypothetical protein